MGPVVSFVARRLVGAVVKKTVVTAFHLEAYDHLFMFGVFGTVEQLLTAPFQAQIPLIGGFTLDTPWSGPPISYVVGRPGTSRELQVEAQMAGQYVFPQYGLLRTHTTGWVDFAYRNDVRGAREVLELIHPGRAELIDQERRPSMPSEHFIFEASSRYTILPDGTIINETTREWWPFGVTGIPKHLEPLPFDWSRIDPSAFLSGDEGGNVPLPLSSLGPDPSPEMSVSSLAVETVLSGFPGGVTRDFTTHGLWRV